MIAGKVSANPDAGFCTIIGLQGVAGIADNMTKFKDEVICNLFRLPSAAAGHATFLIAAFATTGA